MSTKAAVKKVEAVEPEPEAVIEAVKDEQPEQASSMKLVLVGARRYLCRAVKQDPILYMEEIRVDDKLGNKLMDVTYRDKANNDRAMFVEPDHPRVVQYREDFAEAEADVIASRRRARRRARAQA